MTDLKKLRWRCRRGTQELDVMLLRYLDQCYFLADEQERQIFLQLLALEDGDLLHYLIGSSMPESKTLSALISIIRNLKAI